MKLFFRNLLERNGVFKEYSTDEVLDINNTLFKVIADFPITKIHIDNTCIVNKTDRNEMVFHYLKSKNQSIITLKVFTMGYKDKISINKIVIKVDKYSKVYDSYVVEEISKMGDGAFSIIRDGFSYTSRQFEDKYIQYETGEEPNYEEIKNIFIEIVNLATDIIKSPKVELKGERVLVDSCNARKLDSDSAVFFAMHPEYWYQEGNLQPKPIKVLTETFIESRDIYENQFVKYVIYIIQQSAVKLYKSTKNRESNYNSKIEEITAKIKSGDIENERIEELENEKLIVGEKKIKIGIFKTAFLSISNRCNKLLTEIDEKDVILSKNLEVKLTQKILYDKRYFRVFKLFNRYKDEYSIVKSGNVEKKELTYNCYMLYIFIMIAYSLQDLGFSVLNISGVNCDDKLMFEKSDVIKINGKLNSRLENVEFELNCFSLNSNSHPGKIILKIDNRKEIKNIIFNFDFSIKSNITEDEVLKIDMAYDVFNNDEFESNFIVTFLSLEDISFVDYELHKKSIFKLSSMGNNFVNISDYERYGGYKVGMIPLSISSYTNFMNKITSYIRLKIVDKGALQFCTYCRNDSIVKTSTSNAGDSLYTCNYCKKQIAVHPCSCGDTIIKFLNRNADENYVDDENNKNNLPKYHYDYEIKSRFLGACYNRYYSNTGGFCHTCGKCLKLDSDCIRCKIYKEENNNNE